MERRVYDQLEVLIAPTDKELGEKAAEDLATVVKAELAKKGSICIIMALGAAQDAFYAALRARTDIEWSKITVLHVDTYMGVANEPGRKRRLAHAAAPARPRQAQGVLPHAGRFRAGRGRAGALHQAL